MKMKTLARISHQPFGSPEHLFHHLPSEAILGKVHEPSLRISLRHLAKQTVQLCTSVGEKYGLVAVGLLCVIFAAPLSAAKSQNLSAQTETIPEGPSIKVLITKDIRSALLEVKGRYRVIRKDNGSLLSFGVMGKRFVAHALQEGLRWGEEYVDVYQFSIIPQTPETTLYVNGLQYKGALSVYRVRNNLITIVNEVPLEDYLKSVLAVKFKEPVSGEVAAALAIAERTTAYSLISAQRVTPRPWDTTAEKNNYYGYSVTRQPNGFDNAVDQTRFMVMESTKDGKIVQNISLNRAKAIELAELDFDAKKILKTSFPHVKLGLTIDSNKMAIR